MPQSVLLKNARLIDGIADQPQVGMSILVTGERISKVQHGEISVPPDVQIIDVGGKTILPGLIDTHVHSTLMDRESLPLFLAAGVTSARDVRELRKITTVYRGGKAYDPQELLATVPTQVSH